MTIPDISPRRITRRDAIGLALGTAAVLALAACGDAPASPAASSAVPSAASKPATAPSTAAPAASVQAPASSVAASPAASASASGSTSPAASSAAPIPTSATTLNVGIPFLPPTLDPHGGSTAAGLQTLFPVFDSLLRIAEKSQVTPALATAYKNVDPTTWEFALRSGVKFSNGEDFDAESVKFSFDRVMNPDNKLPAAARTTVFSGVEIVDKMTVRLKTKDPTPTVPQLVTAIFMVPAKALQAVGDKAFITKPIGTGAFTVQEYVPNDHLALARSDTTWRPKAPLAGIRFQAIPDDGARLAALQSGQLDLIQDVIADKANSLGADLQPVQAASGPMLHLQLKTDSGPMADKRVRQALNYAIDKDSLVKNLLQGFGLVADGQIIGKDALGYNPNLKPFPFDPAKAMSLLSDAGLKDGFSTELHVSSASIFGKAVGEAISGFLGKVGVKAAVQVLESARYVDEFNKGPRPGLLLFAINDPPYDASFAYARFPTTALPGVAHWTNPQFDQLWNAQLKEFDGPKREQELQQMSQVMYDDAGSVFLYQSPHVYAMKKTVKWTPGPGSVLWFDDATKG